MVLTENEASTLKKYPAAILPWIKHQDYYYFPFQDNPEIETLLGRISWLGLNYIFSVAGEPESETGFLSAIYAKKALSPLYYEPFRKQVVLFTSSLDESYKRSTSIPFASNYDIFDVFSTSSRQLQYTDFHLEQNVINTIDSYQYEEFDSDVASDFTNALDELIQAHGKPIVFIINRLIKKHAYNNTMRLEILRALGRIENGSTKNERYEILIDALKSSSVIIRDAAISGLSFLDIKGALPQLYMLLQTETSQTLKNNIRVAIKGLET